MHLTITLTANTFEELLAAAKGIADAVGPDKIVGAEMAGELAVDVLVAQTAEDDATATKAKKGKSSKAKKADPEPAAKPDTGLEPEATDAPAGETTAEDKPDLRAVEDLTPETAREQGISEVQIFFGKNPNAMPDIKRLQTKYGVKKFQEIGDDRAHEFLADVKLLMSGNPVAA